ncbi:MAG TPA: adenine deaminase [Clostridiales bacterium]|nr:adenine deaminase [Clostridiales bacterium]
MLEKKLSVARGNTRADLVLKNANVINVFTETIERLDVAICGDTIVGLGDYTGDREIDCTGKYVAPGFIDGHIHLESSMLKPVEFAKAVLAHGTTAVITDPHEITNVCGISGLEYMLRASEDLPLDVYFMLPSCVPATAFDENGAVLKAAELEGFYEQERVLGLAEVMDYTGTIQGDGDLLRKINYAKQQNRVVDGHAPGVLGKQACAYIAAGIQSDHECSDLEEAKEKYSRGQWIMIREGSAAKNLNALMGLFQAPFHQRSMLVTDDKHPYDLLEAGHLDGILRQAIENGVDPCIAIKMVTLNPATYFQLRNTGAVAPGYKADILILSGLTDLRVERVIKNGTIAAEAGQVCPMAEPEPDQDILDRVYHSFHCKELTPADFMVKLDKEPVQPDSLRVIQLLEGEILTKELILPLEEDEPGALVEEDLLKLAVIERHHNTGHIGIGFIHGYGLKQGAIASSVAHDSHNIIAVGTNDGDLAAAANCIRQMQGGWVIVRDGEILAKLPLPIAGLMSELDAQTLASEVRGLQAVARKLGVKEGIDPFLTLAFVSLPVIPELRLITTGLFNVGAQRLVPLIL